MRKNVTATVIAACAFGLGLSAARASIATFRGVGIPSGSTASYAGGISDDGAIMGGTALNGFASAPYRFNGSLQNLVVPAGGSGANVTGVSGSGSVMVGTSSFGPQELRICRWESPVDAPVTYGPLPGYVGAWSTGVSRNGNVITGYCSRSGQSSYPSKWVNGVAQDLGLPAGVPSAIALACSLDGAYCVGYTYPDSGGNRGLRWNPDGSITDIGVLPGGYSSTARVVSADGSIVAGVHSTSGGVVRPVIWSASGGLTSLITVANTTQWTVDSMSGAGDMIGGSHGNGSNARAFLWTKAGGVQDLKTMLESRGASLAGWTLTSLQGISSDGSFLTGDGVNPLGKNEAWIAQIPAPGVGALCLGSAALWLRRRR